MSESQLEILAGRAGLAVDWVDANGRPQRVEPYVLQAVLAGLGLPADSNAAIETSLLNLQLEQQDKRLPPLLTADEGKGLDLARYFSPTVTAWCTWKRADHWIFNWTPMPICPA